MKTVYNLILITVFWMWEVHGCADSVSAVPGAFTSKVICVIESHQHHQEVPRLIFFDVVGDASQPLHLLITSKLKDLTLVERDVNLFGLELFGVRRGASVLEGWSKITEEQIDAFWTSVGALGADGAAARDLNIIPLGAVRLADYVINVNFQRSY